MTDKNMTDKNTTDKNMIETHDNKNAPGHGAFERRDIGVAGIIYFLVGLAAATILVHLLLVGLYRFLDKRAQSQEPALSPMVTRAPGDTRHIPQNYPETAFPDPRLETDERTQLDSMRIAEEEKLNSYGWVDENAGTVRIPIERGMDLLVQRGLPVRQESGKPPAAAASPGRKKGSKQ